MKWLWILLLVPVVGAQMDIREHHQVLLQDTSPTGIIEPHDVSVEVWHDWNSTITQSTLLIQATYSVSSGALNPSADFQVQWNGLPVQDCQWRVQGGTSRHTAYVAHSCPIPAATPGTHVLAVGQIAAAGEAIQHATLTVTLRQTEVVDMDLHVTVTSQTFANVVWIVWLGYFVLTRFIRHPMMAVLASLVGFGMLALPIRDDEFWLIAAAQGLVIFYDVSRLFTGDQ